MPKRFARAIILVCLALLLAASVPAQDKPLPLSGYLNFKVTSVGLGVGATWGSGSLSFQGKQYPVRVEGIDLAKVGVAELEAVGRVYNLKKPDDIFGTYNQVGAGLAVVGGIKGMALRNAKGVIIDLTAIQRGIAASLGIGSLQIKRP